MTAIPATHVPAAAAADRRAVIELDQLRVRFGSHEVLRGLTGTFSGRAIGLLGPNGAGKTTLLHTLLGFYPPAAGSGRIFGHDVEREIKAVRAQLGYMPERDAFIAELTGVHFVRLMAELSGLPPGAALERAHEAMFYVGLGEARYRKLQGYSLGMKQLVKLAQAIVHGPRLLFLDEPTNGLDPPHRARMLKLIREIRDSGDTHIIFSSHLLRDVEECCDEVLILKDGEIAAYCNLEHERRTNRAFLDVEIRGDDKPFLEAVQKLGIECAVHSRRRFKMVLQDDVSVADLYRIASEQQVQLRRMSAKRDSLEDIFLKAMEGNSSAGSAQEEVNHGGL